MKNKKTKLSLEKVICPELVRVNVVAKDRDDAIRVAGKVLVDARIVENKYIDAMIQTCNDLGPYIVLAPHVAIPHARPEDGVNKVGFSIITLKEPIPFGNESNDPVKIVIAFASPDRDQHVEILSGLATFLQNDDLINGVCKAESREDIVNYLCEDGWNHKPESES